MSAERETMIEVMARAMCVNQDQDPDHVFVPVTGKPESVVMWKHWKADAEAALTALEAAGVRLVPVEATVEMQTAGYELMGAGSQFVYRAMLAASPYAPEGTRND